DGFGASCLAMTIKILYYPYFAGGSTENPSMGKNLLCHGLRFAHLRPASAKRSVLKKEKN
ncbi:MAG: hypothetical protein KAJ05_08050, partial [Candidatus Latescibacteria bacterium]|nr:hypothetical protein [Candidatus Latescibacterota bacterium]